MVDCGRGGAGVVVVVAGTGTSADRVSDLLPSSSNCSGVVVSEGTESLLRLVAAIVEVVAVTVVKGWEVLKGVSILNGRALNEGDGCSRGGQ